VRLGRRSTRIGRRGCLIGVPLIISLFLIACGGGTASIPSTGAGVCDGLKQAERFRYVFSYTIESVNPTAGDFSLNIKHDGSAVPPDSLDFELSVPGTPAVRTIRIGEKQWVNLAGSWQEQMNPGPFPFQPTLVCDAVLSTLDVPAATGTPEQVGDSEARHFRFTAVPVDTGSKLFGPQSDMGRLLKSYDVDMWIGEDDGRLVKVEAASTAAYPSGGELTMRITLEAGSYNDDGIVIQPPS
jgi:hypothetical protein